jgi:hypothetical protein
MKITFHATRAMIVVGWGAQLIVGHGSSRHGHQYAALELASIEAAV